jgi:hypothetical protein
VVPENANWFDLTLTFSANSSSSTSNPFAIVLVSQGGGYPFTGYVTLYDATSTGSPIWTSGTNTYCGSTLLKSLNSVTSTLPPGLWCPLFVFNDTSVQIACTIQFIWRSVGESNVYITNVDGDT